LAANLGVTTGKIENREWKKDEELHEMESFIIVGVLNFAGKHLSELCKAEYPLLVKYCLWLLAELAVIAADIPEGFFFFFFFPSSFDPNLIGKSFFHTI